MESASEDLNCAEQGMAGTRPGVVAKPDTFQNNIFWVCRACDITFALRPDTTTLSRMRVRGSSPGIS